MTEPATRSTPARIACLFVRRFAAAAWLRTDPDLHGAALAVTDGPGPRARVVACTLEAEGKGVTAGLSAAQAAAIARDLVVRPASPAAEQAAQAALCDVAYACSPRVEEGGAGTVYVDAGGLRGLFRGEAELARTAAGNARTLGLEAAVGIASTKLAARLAAQGGGAVIAPEEEWRFLAPLPIGLLAPAPALAQTLARWGIRTLGDLAALPASAVATRLGPEGAQLARRARGEDEYPLAPRPAPLRFEESVEIDYGLAAIEPFLFVLRGLLDRLVARLAVRGFVCGDLRLSLGLAGRGRDERIVAVAAPSTEVKALLALIRLQLEAHPPPAAIETIRVAAVPECLRAEQLDLFRPHGPAPAQLAVTLARLAALCGPDRLGAPVVADSHRPDAYGLTAWRGSVLPSAVSLRDRSTIPSPALLADERPPLPALVRGEGWGEGSNAWPAAPPLVTAVPSPPPSPASDAGEEAGGGAASIPIVRGEAKVHDDSPSSDAGEADGRVAVRAVRPPRALEVFCHRGQPDVVRLAADDGEPPDAYRCTGRVVTMAGPWRVQGEWWHAEAAFCRDYYDVQLSDGVVYRLFFDRARQQWFVDGVYD